MLVIILQVKNNALFCCICRLSYSLTQNSALCFYLLTFFSLYTLWSFIFLFTLHTLKRNETNKWRWTPLQHLFSFYYWRVHTAVHVVYVCVCSRHNHLSKPVGRITRCLLYSIPSVITWLYDSTKLYITCMFMSVLDIAYTEAEFMNVQFRWGFSKSCLRSLQIMARTSTKLYVHEFGFWSSVFYYSMKKTGNGRKMFIARVNMERWVSMCWAPFQAPVMGQKPFITRYTACATLYCTVVKCKWREAKISPKNKYSY